MIGAEMIFLWTELQWTTIELYLTKLNCTYLNIRRTDMDLTKQVTRWIKRYRNEMIWTEFNRSKPSLDSTEMDGTEPKWSELE